MIKLCPACRMMNQADEACCTGCGYDLARVAAKASASGITMFGSMPQEASVKPLEKAVPTNAQAYGQAQVSIAHDEDDDDLPTPAQKLSASTGQSKSTPKKARPKKPWE